MIELEQPRKMTAPQYERTTQDLRKWMSQGEGANSTNANSEATGTGGHASIQVSGGMVAGALIGVAALISIGFSVLAMERAERAIDTARMMERENRIMQDDLKFVRAYLSARGIDVPANHEEAEEKRK